MRVSDAMVLAGSLRSGSCHAEIDRSNPVDPRIRFVSPVTGTHSLDVWASDEERVRAHWDVFVRVQPSEVAP